MAQGSMADLAEGDGIVALVEECTWSRWCVSGKESVVRKDETRQGFAGEVALYSDCADEV